MSEHDSLASSEIEPPTTLSEEEQYKQQRYFEWQDAERAWLQRCHLAELAIREQYAQKQRIHPDYLPAQQPWEVEGLSEREQYQERTRVRLEEFISGGHEFSPAAHLILNSYETAKAYDDMKCDYTGHPDHLSWFREISPSHNETGTDVQFAYDKGILNAYAGFNIVHIRETLNPLAVSREQKMFVVVMNLLSREVKRWYVEGDEISSILPAKRTSALSSVEIEDGHLDGKSEGELATVTFLQAPAFVEEYEETEEQGEEAEKSITLLSPNLTYEPPFHPQVKGADEIFDLKPRRLTSYNGVTVPDSNNPFAGIYEQLEEASEKALQPKIKKSADGYWAFQEEGGAGYVRLHNLKELDAQRQLLQDVAIAEGIELGDRGVIIQQTLARNRSA